MVETVASQNAAAGLPDRCLLGAIGCRDAKSSALGLGEFMGRPSGINGFLIYPAVEECFFGLIRSLRDFSAAAVTLELVISRLGEYSIALPVPLEVGIGG